jgi:hypothetical protein
MWKLIILIAFIPFAYSPEDTQGEIVLILDDCQNWRQGLKGKYPDAFSFSKSLENHESVGLIHGWLDPEKKLASRILTYPELLRMNPIFTSELSYSDWNDLLNSPKKKFYILRPDDYCSKRRFEYRYEFTLYEVVISLSSKE